MIKLNRVLGGALLAFALIGSQMAQADEEKAVSLLIKPKVGRVMRTKGVIKTSVMGMDLVVNQTLKDTVKEIEENGDVVFEIADEGTTISIGGMDRDNPAAPPYMTTHDKFGKVKVFKKSEDNGFTTPEISKVMEALGTFILTDKAVKTNDTWQTELENPAVKEKKITVKDTYLGLDKVDGKSYWKIKQTAEVVVDADGSKVTYEITEWVSTTDGEAIKMEGSVKDLPTQAGPVTLQISSKSSPADDKEKPAPAKP